MSNCGAIIVSRQREGKVAADWIRSALNNQGDFNNVEVKFNRNENGNYVIKINFGLLSGNHSMGVHRDKLEEMANKKVVMEADIIEYGMVENYQIKDITIQSVNSQGRSMSR